MESNIFWQGTSFLFEASKGLPFGPVKKDGGRVGGWGWGVACSAFVQATEGSAGASYCPSAKFNCSDSPGQPAGCSYLGR